MAKQLVEADESAAMYQRQRLAAEAEVERLRAEVELLRADGATCAASKQAQRADRLEAALREIAEEAVEVEARDLRRMAQKALAEGE
jgi:hypothetical protein